QVAIQPVRGRYARLVALSEVNGKGWASIAELQLIGDGGKNLPRDGWKIHKADSFESKDGRNAKPENILDGNRGSWWHTPWIGGIPPHPHEIQIDLGAEQEISGIRYLPAVIINNNGMIRKYEFFVSRDGKTWGEPVAKGVLVNDVQIVRASVGENAVYFESNRRSDEPAHVFRYAMDGKPAQLVRDSNQVLFLKEPYFVTTVRNDQNKDVLLAHRFDDPNYRFELGTTKQFDAKGIDVVGDRLVMGRRGVLVADLANQRFIVAPSDPKLKHNQNGLVVMEGDDSLFKIVHRGNEGQTVFRFDLRTGQRTESVLANQIEPFHDPKQRRARQRMPRFNGLLLLNDASTISAWISRADSEE
ncbi:MAG: discoidin domain-containing protein, partial [Planctomycetales bacterium]